MSRGYILFFFIFFNSASTLKAQSSPLKEGQWVKLAVAKQGIFKVTGAQMKSMGYVLPFPSNQVQLFNNDLRHLQDKVSANPLNGLYENAIELSDGGDGQFDELDYFLFYSEGSLYWRMSENDSLPTHVKMASEDSIYFFLTLGKNGKRIQTLPIVERTEHVVDWYNERWLIEKDSISLLNSGKLWLGNPMGVGAGKQNQQNFTLSTEGLRTLSPLQCNMQVAAASYIGPANFTILWNEKPIHQLSINPVSGYIYDERALLKKSNFEWNNTAEIPVGNTSQLSVQFTSAASTSTGWIDFIELHAKRKLGFWGKQAFGFRNYKVLFPHEAQVYKIQGADNTTKVWNVTHPQIPLNVPLQLEADSVGVFVHKNDTLNEFYVTTRNAFETPVFVGKMSNQNIMGMDHYDYIIITAPAFKEAAKSLQSFHKITNQMNVEVLDVNEVYNEFSGGQPSSIGIRNCVQYFYHKAVAQNVAPLQYLLLMGVGNFDSKNIQVLQQVPTFQSEASTGILSSFTSDDFYAILTEGLDINYPANIKNLSLAVGRIPARTALEANTIVQKIINYQQSPIYGSWKNQITWVADDGDYNLHLQDVEDISSHLNKNAPNWSQRKLYLDFYPSVSTSSGNTYPAIISDIRQMVNNGTAILNYSGHGNYLRLSEEAVISKTEFDQWDNAGKLPLMITASCDFAPYDQPHLTPIGFDAMMKNEKGVVGLVAASRLVFAYSNKQINDEYIQQLLTPNHENKTHTIGQALMHAKIKNWEQSGDQVNAFKFTLLGDPAMQLQRPKHNVVIQALNQKAFSGSDTLHTATVYRIAGEVQSLGVKKSNFSGLVEFILWDAAYQKNTLGNQSTSMPVPISVQEKVLFKGKASVRSGVFSFDFILPRETMSTIEKPFKMQLYAYADTTDALGVYDQLFVDNASENMNKDSIGPVMNAYINDTNFVDGTWVAGNSRLFIHLEDSAGIQTSGNSLGHDLKLILDRDYQNPILLNNYYTASLDTYQKGVVQFDLPVFAPGKHELILKAWDLLGNSTTDTLYCLVPTTGQLEIRNFSISPNPSRNFTKFSFEHNQHDASLEIVLEIFDINGLSVYSNKSLSTNAGNRVVINWEGTSINGGKLLPGVYLCKLTVSNGVNKSTLSTKLMKY